MRKKLKFYKALLVEIIETLCTICLYLEQDGRRSGNELSRHMEGHFIVLKGFSEDLRGVEEEMRWKKNDKRRM